GERLEKMKDAPVANRPGRQHQQTGNRKNHSRSERATEKLYGVRSPARRDTALDHRGRFIICFIQSAVVASLCRRTPKSQQSRDQNRETDCGGEQSAVRAKHHSQTSEQSRKTPPEN